MLIPTQKLQQHKQSIISNIESNNNTKCTHKLNTRSLLRHPARKRSGPILKQKTRTK